MTHMYSLPPPSPTPFPCPPCQADGSVPLCRRPSSPTHTNPPPPPFPQYPLPLLQISAHHQPHAQRCQTPVLISVVPGLCCATCSITLMTVSTTSSCLMMGSHNNLDDLIKLPECLMTVSMMCVTSVKISSSLLEVIPFSKSSNSTS